MFVPFFVCIMLWRNRERLATCAGSPRGPAWPWSFRALLLLLLARHVGRHTVQSLSFCLLLLGATLLLFGTSKTRLLLFPLLFVMMMMPLIPDQLINGIAFPIQLTSAQLAIWLLNLSR